MHRSGTSAVARLLNLLGPEIGSNLVAAEKWNEKGHWELLPLVHLSDDILRLLGRSWSDTRPLPSGWLDQCVEAGFVEKGVALLLTNFGSSRSWVVKDPRLSRLGPFWDLVMERLSLDSRYVICCRHPSEVAKSLTRRNEFPVERSLLLWLRHVAAIEASSRGKRRSIVFFDNVLTDWRAAVEKVARDLDIPSWPRDPQEAAADISDFLDSKLRHHHASGRDNDLPPLILRAYKALQSGDEAIIAAEFDALAPDIAALDAAAMTSSWPAADAGKLVQAAYALGVEDLAAEAHANIREAERLRVGLANQDRMVGHLRIELDAARAELTEAQSRTGVLQAEVAQQSTTETLLRSELQSARDLCSAAERTRMLLAEERDSLQHLIAALKTKAEAETILRDVERERLQAERVYAEERQSRQADAFARAQDALMRERDAEKEALIREKEALEREKGALEREKDALEQNYKAELDRLGRENQDALAREKEALEQNHRVELNRFDREKQALQLDLDEMSIRVSVAEQELENVRAKLELEKSRVDSLVAENDRLTQMLSTEHSKIWEVAGLVLGT